MSERNCLKCRHCYIDPGEADWSDVTPGTDPDMHCNKKHWRLNSFDYDRAALFRAFTTALTCPDYDEEPTPERRTAGEG